MKIYMKLGEKLRKYLDDNGLHYNWFEMQVGMPPKSLYAILDCRKKMPQKYWKAVIILTQNHITLNDLAEIDNEEIDPKRRKKTKK